MKYYQLLILIFYVCNISCDSDDKCNFYTCGDCISFAGDHCLWCTDENLPKNTRRCLSRSAANTKKTKWCNKTIDVIPQYENIIDEPFNETVNGVTVQLKPQSIYIKARPEVPIPFNISFEPLKDFPLDVYYVMDISYSMKSSKEDLRNQATKIYKTLTDYTNNVRLGIGSFVEKPAFPYVDELKKDKHISYAFKNLLSLTDNVDEFRSTIDKIAFGANYDDPESGLDALMQAMVCKTELGWRSGARKIIILCSDSTYHSAGDGKVIGVIKPNDMQCHLKDNLYDKTMSLTYDYPSVSQINQIARKNNFIIVFAVKDNVKEDYIALAKHILGAKYANLKDSKAAVEIIKQVYLEYAQSAPLYYDFPSFIKLDLDPDCKTTLTSNCKSTPEQRTITTNATLTVKYCPRDGNFKHKLKIGAIGLEDKINIELDITCKCDCENDNGEITPKCNNAGFMQCGICKCNPGSYGVDCRCNGTSTANEEMKLCYMNDDDKEWCSGKGECRCGKCEQCYKGYSGNFCQYNDESCPRNNNNEMCSGHGICTLGSCKCDSQWTSDDCSCSLDIVTCVAPYSKDICSGNGDCKCGMCVCHKIKENNETYSGRFCDVCDDCAEKRCKELKSYVICNVMNEKKVCDKTHEPTIVFFLNKTEINGPGWEMAKWCSTQLVNKSIIIFKYKYDEGELVLGIQNEAELPPEANKYVAIGSAIGIVLLIGIITLIVWKILIDIHDKREYKKFIEEAEAAGYQNVLYTPPTQLYRNPAFESN